MESKTQKKLEYEKWKIEKDNVTFLEYALQKNEFICLLIAFEYKSPQTARFFYVEYMRRKYLDYWLLTKLSKKKITFDKSALYNLNYNDSLKIEKFLREENVNFYNYYVIQNCLEKLESYGILVSRTLEQKIANKIWYISPEFYFKYGEKFIETFNKEFCYNIIKEFINKLNFKRKRGK
jgi:hypothetical protein